jgi:tetratricopeptide (TPR) repeat protein
VLKARCLSELGLHEAALRVLRHARSRVSDPQARILILKLEADCVRATTRALEGRLIELLGKHQVAEALQLVNEGLRRQPSNIVFLYHLANVKWLSGDREAALRTIEEARRHVGRESIDFIDELERKIEFGPHWDAVEAARLALRCGDSEAATRHLESCTALKGNEQFDGLHAYAEQKRRTLSQLFRTKAAAPLDSSRQQTLRWLLAEEVRRADAALRAGDHAQARAALEEAAKIDAGCAAVCQRHARAIFLFYRKAFDQQASTVRRAATDDLKTAEDLAARAAADPDYREQSQTLLKSIQELRARLR